ncbi:acid protease [Gyrodon lividus]|nr:acid protease [Gyrodon lividus]
MYDRASDQATNLARLNSSTIDPFTVHTIFSPGVVVASGARVSEAVNNSTDDPLTDEVGGNADLEYYGPLSFGSQAQPLTIDFDTGSADLWIPVNCSDCGDLEQFQASSSSTYQQTDRYFEVTYGIGQVSGTLANDTVSIGSFSVANQYFGAVNSVSENFAQSPNDGLAGLAFSTISNSRKPTFFENLISQGFVQAPLFSVYLTRGQIQGSEICFGCIDTSKTSEETVQWVPVVSKTYWTVGMGGVSVNGSLVSTGGLTGIIDTGTSFIYVPESTADGVYALIPGSAPAPGYGDGYYYYPCDSQVQISFVFNNQKFALDARDFNLGVSYGDPSTCIGAIIGSGSSDAIAIIPGDSFLKSYVSVYDYSHNARVGFVKSINE